MHTVREKQEQEQEGGRPETHKHRGDETPGTVGLRCAVLPKRFVVLFCLPPFFSEKEKPRANLGLAMVWSPPSDDDDDDLRVWLRMFPSGSPSYLLVIFFGACLLVC
ncbi:pyridoxal-5'-phosphate-dependent protein subunit beta [Anopheles sinensis]|uniref:Pyridoxal-5'-phosphate-dependent protein subunit beta n=1 Tax=Anopheles sinensis TaxID=74873 RepID=A0A084WRF1_ANOSI|nr:pyridoxal-5'-phosphate-dependent protein subunit beta [Anopheles sinensis]